MEPELTEHFLDKEWLPDQEKVNKAIAVLKESNARQGNPIPEEELPGLLRQIIDKKQFSNAALNPEDLLNDSTLRGVLSGPLKNRTVDNEFIRDFLGEYTCKKRNFYRKKRRTSSKGKRNVRQAICNYWQRKIL
jgi:hypothetical protein